MNKIPLLMLIFSAFFITNSYCQEFNSSMGIGLTTNLSDGIGYQWSGKIYVSENDALSGFVGMISRKPKVSSVGAGISYNRHVNLMDIDHLFFYYGVGLRGFIGDLKGGGFGPLAGISYNIRETTNIDIEFHPNYLIGVKDKVTGENKAFDPRINISFRYISK